MKNKNYWIQSTGVKKHHGDLHKQLGYVPGHEIPSKLLTEISNANLGTKVRGHTVTPLLKKRAVLARTLRRYHE